MSTDQRAIRILKKLCNLEVMAVQIYRTQVGKLADPDEQSMMLSAMENEEHHRETFRSLLEKREVASSPRWPFFWLVGQILGRLTSLFGRKAILRGDIAFENKASREYSGFLDEGGFTEEETSHISEFLDDERRHSANWRKLLEEK
jgi:demethoxyubiquinone hydroxylase (CLK1/Coq7/Cat5 family)